MTSNNNMSIFQQAEAAAADDFAAYREALVFQSEWIKRAAQAQSAYIDAAIYAEAYDSEAANTAAAKAWAKCEACQECVEMCEAIVARWWEAYQVTYNTHLEAARLATATR
jgi:NAD-dependent dihydropyrimidine dehydrogenase PreA subunit